MKKKELVSMFMESPFYFELTPRERLFLLEDHRRRFSRRLVSGPHYAGRAAAPKGEGEGFGDVLYTLKDAPWEIG